MAPSSQGREWNVSVLEVAHLCTGFAHSLGGKPAIADRVPGMDWMKCEAYELLRMGWGRSTQCRQCSVDQMARAMTFRIESAVRARFTVFILSGRIEKEAIAVLRRLCEPQPDSRDIVFDLKDVSVVDRSALHFFADCEADGVKLENCAAYIREWMEREKQ